MKYIYSIVLAAIYMSIYLIGTAWAKPDEVDGVNVPFGRIPQEIIDNKYPRTYFPGTERVANHPT